VVETINKAPLKKATGPSTISNEILKKLPPVAHELLTKIFNAYLQLKTISQKWYASLVWPILKKPQYNGNLISTRPITPSKQCSSPLLINHDHNPTIKSHNGRCPHIQPRILDFTPGHVESLRYCTHSPTTTRPQPAQYFFQNN
ncbi:17907_t:CDS:2, partial [Gigaspora rosea]